MINLEPIASGERDYSRSILKYSYQLFIVLKKENKTMNYIVLMTIDNTFQKFYCL